MAATFGLPYRVRQSGLSVDRTLSQMFGEISEIIHQIAQNMRGRYVEVFAETTSRMLQAAQQIDPWAGWRQIGYIDDTGIDGFGRAAEPFDLSRIVPRVDLGEYVMSPSAADMARLVDVDGLTLDVNHAQFSDALRALRKTGWTMWDRPKVQLGPQLCGWCDRPLKSPSGDPLCEQYHEPEPDQPG